MRLLFSCLTLVLLAISGAYTGLPCCVYTGWDGKSCSDYWYSQCRSAGWGGVLVCEGQLVKKCAPGFHCGKCRVNVYDEGKCRCVDNRKAPEFPRTGRIAWTGTVKHYGYWSPYTGNYSFSGHIQMTNDGRYLLKTFSQWDYWQGWEPKVRSSVTIIVPNGDGSFMEYKGDGNGGLCTNITTRTDNRKQQSTWLWPHFTKDVRDIYELVETKGDIQKWKVYHRNLHSAMNRLFTDRWWTMTVEKVKGEENVGIPQKFYMDDQRDDDGWWKTYADFNYHPIDTFEISDYCGGGG